IHTIKNVGGRCNMSLIGKEMAPFSADAYNSSNGEFIEVTDNDLKGKWAVVLFCPADFSFVCPTELEDLQEQYETLNELGAEVYSVSTDTHFVHKAWHDHSEAINKIRCTTIAVRYRSSPRNFDVLDEERGLAQRGRFTSYPGGGIQAAEINADGIGRDASALIDKIKAANYVRRNPGE